MDYEETIGLTAGEDGCYAFVYAFLAIPEIAKAIAARGFNAKDYSLDTERDVDRAYYNVDHYDYPYVTYEFSTSDLNYVNHEGNDDEIIQSIMKDIEDAWMNEHTSSPPIFNSKAYKEEQKRTQYRLRTSSRFKVDDVTGIKRDDLNRHFKKEISQHGYDKVKETYDKIEQELEVGWKRAVDFNSAPIGGTDIYDFLPKYIVFDKNSTDWTLCYLLNEGVEIIVRKQTKEALAS